MTFYMGNVEYRNEKSALTRAINKAKRASSTTDKIKYTKAIVEHVNRTFAKWDQGNYAYPDAWHRWTIAKDDAISQLWLWREPF